MKKVLSLVLVLAMVLGTFSFAFAASDDITGHENEAAIRRLVKLGLVKGDARGYRPDDTLTRAEAATLVVRALGKEDIAKLAVNSSAFSDVPTDYWAAGYINLASQLGYVNGYPDGTFRPNNTLTYNEALALMVKVLGYNPKATQNGGWPLGYVVVADELGITDDTIGFADAPTTRANMFQMLDNSLTVDMMVQKGFGDDMTWEVEEDKNILSEIGFEQIKGERVIALDTKHDEIEFEEYGEVSVPEDFDYEEVFGLKLDAWVNEDGELVVYEVKDEPIFDAIEWDSDDEVLTAVFADEDYELAEDVALYENGESVKVKNFDKDYDYAKIVLNDDDEVVFVDAYDWDNSIVVDEVDKYDVVGYDVEAAEEILDAEDFVIVKEGKTISLDDLSEGDILFYNEDAKYAEVFNNSVEGEIEAVFDGEFDFDGDTYAVNNATYIEYGDDIEDIDALTEDVLDDMKASEKDVEVFFTRDGKVRHVVGVLDEAETTDVAAYVVRAGFLREARGTTYYFFDVVNEEGKYIEYDVTLDDFAALDDNSDTDLLDNESDESMIKLKEDTVEETFAAGDVVTISIDEDGAIDSISKVGSPATKDGDIEYISIDIEDDKYADGYKLVDSAIVFNLNDYTDDADDITVAKYGELDFDKITKGYVFGNSKGKVAYIVAKETSEDTNTEYAMVTDIRTLSSGKSRVYIIVNGKEMYEDFSDIKGAKVGEMLQVKLPEDEDTFEIEGTYSEDDTVKLSDITVRLDKLTVGDSVYYLSDEAYIFDATDIDEIKEVSLRDVKEGSTAKLYFEGDSNKIVEFVVVTKGPEEDSKTEDSDLVFDAKLRFDYTVGDTTIRLLVGEDEEKVSYNVNENSIILDKDGNEIDAGILIEAGKKLTFELIKGTDTIDIIQFVE